MKKIYLILLSSFILMASCDNEEPIPVDNTPIQPTTYGFDNVDFSGQTARLDMLGELTAEMKKPGSGTAADAQKMLSMFSNSNSPFADGSLNASTKQLKNKCYDGSGAAMSAASFEHYMNLLASLSATNSGVWAPGVAGVATSGTKAYYFDENGVEYAQIVEKGLMGAVFYFQISENYTREGKIGAGVDNAIVNDGKGTDMEHHWDEAFGYFGAPIDLTEENYESASLRYHAKYAKKGSAVGLNTVGNVMAQFIRGRFSISNKNAADRDAAATQLRSEYEIIMVTTAIHYLNGAISNFSDDAIRNHELSEAYAFIVSLHYNSDKLISDSDLKGVQDNFREDIGGQEVLNFLNITVSDIRATINQLSSVYGLDAVKDQL